MNKSFKTLVLALFCAMAIGSKTQTSGVFSSVSEYVQKTPVLDDLWFITKGTGKLVFNLGKVFLIPLRLTVAGANSMLDSVDTRAIAQEFSNLSTPAKVVTAGGFMALGVALWEHKAIYNKIKSLF